MAETALANLAGSSGLATWQSPQHVRFKDLKEANWLFVREACGACAGACTATSPAELDCTNGAILH